MKKLIVGACAVIALAIGGGFLWLQQESQPPQAQFREPQGEYPQQVEISYRVRIENATPRTLGQARGEIYLPVAEHATQWLQDVSVQGLAGEEFRVVTDRLGNRTLYFTLENFSANTVRDVRISTTLARSDAVNQLEVEDLQTFSTLGDELSMLLEALSVEEGALAGTSATEVMENALVVARRTEFEDGDALYETGRRVVALARSEGIPARLVLGLSADASVSLTPWVEYWEGGWRPLYLTDRAHVSSVALRLLEDQQLAESVRDLRVLVAEGAGLRFAFE